MATTCQADLDRNVIRSTRLALNVTGANHCRPTKAISHKSANHCFVKNNVKEPLLNPKIKSQKTFDEVFVEVTVMGNDVASTPIDFTEQYVIAVVVPASDRVVRLRPVSLQKDAKGNFVFTEDFGVKQTYKSSTDFIILVYKKVTVKVLLQETK